jgi:uncharacterized repeat protein (TIGR02543 family)
MKMITKHKKYIAIALTLALVFTFAPLSGMEVFAADAGEDAATAQDINVNQTYTDNLSTSSDVDWFKFTLPGKGKVSVTMTFPYSTSTLYHCYFYPVSGDASNYYNYLMGKGDNATTNTYRLPAGTYYIRITDYTFVNTDYTIKVSYTSETNIYTEAEHNDSTATATTLSLNTPYLGNLSTSSDVDWYKFTLSKDAKVRAQMTFPYSTSTLYHCYFYPVSGDASNYYNYLVGKGDNAATNTYNLPAGTYYIRITDYTFVNTDYKLTIQNVSQVNFNANGGEVSPSSKQVGVGEVVGTLPKATRSGYKFAGWYTAKSGGTKITANAKITKNISYYAHWTAKTYKVKFNVNKGKKLSASKSKKTVTYAKKYGTLPKATRRGYKFAGWYTDKYGGSKITAGSKVKITKTTTLYAHWK